jgi:hypothetical protein
VKASSRMEPEPARMSEHRRLLLAA